MKCLAICILFFSKVTFSEEVDNINNPQILNLNVKFSSKGKTLNSNVSIPFYQKAEITSLENQLENNKNKLPKDSYFEVNPSLGPNKNEIQLELKFYRMSGIRHLSKRKVMAKLGEETKISLKGMVLKLTPSIEI